jgi:hypothetical protein
VRWFPGHRGIGRFLAGTLYIGTQRLAGLELPA